MSFSGRSVATVALLLGGIIGWSSAVVAADWPRRTVHIIAPVRSDSPNAGGSPSSWKIGREPMG